MSENYHKAALGGGVVILAAVGYLSWSGASELQEKFEDDVPPKITNDPSVPGGEEADAITQSLKEVNVLDQKPVPSGRKVDLFTSVDLFVENGDTRKVIDLLQVGPVHEGIDNEWWVVNRVDPSYSDSPDRDQDGDGFTNREEHDSPTDPSNEKDYPILVEKLEVREIDTTYWLVELNSGFGNNNFQFSYKDNKAQSIKMRAVANVQIGDVFFDEKPALGRFKVLKKDEEMVMIGGQQKPQKFALIEDQKVNKKGKVYKAPYRPKKARKNLFYQFDNTVTFVLNAAGQGKKTYTVEENESFKMTVDGKDLEYKLVEVDMGKRPNVEPLAVVVEYEENGEKKTRRIPVKK